MAELSLPLHFQKDMPSYTSCPVGHAYVDSTGKVFVRGYNNVWAHVGHETQLLPPTPKERTYLRRSLGLAKGTRLP